MDLDLSINEVMEKRVEGKSFGSLVLKFRRPTKEQMDKVDGLTTVGAARQRMDNTIRGINGAADAYAYMFRFKAESVIVGWDDVWEVARDKDGTVIMDDGNPKKVPVKYAFRTLMAACGRYPELSEEVSLIANALYAGLDPMVRDAKELGEDVEAVKEEEKNSLPLPEHTSEAPPAEAALPPTTQ